MNTPNLERTTWIKGSNFLCDARPPRVEHPWRLVLLGAPGVGKGTQAELLCRHLGVCHLATGDIFRAANSVSTEKLSPAIAAALEYMRRGELVPDQGVLGIVRERMRCLHCRGGFLLDGFPRTVVQAEGLQKMLNEEGLSLSAVIDYEMDLETIVRRLTGRLTCSKCGASFHSVGNPPKEKGVCNFCQGSLFVRADDQPEIIHNRILAYKKTITPLLEYYASLGLLISVKAEFSPTEIFQQTLDLLQVPGQ